MLKYMYTCVSVWQANSCHDFKEENGILVVSILYVTLSLYHFQD